MGRPWMGFEGLLLQGLQMGYEGLLLQQPHPGRRW